jgi:hypothetical protein
MEQLLRRWRTSGLSLSAFAREEGISRDRLQYWQRKLTRQLGQRAAGRGSSALVPVRLVGGPSEAALEVVLAGGDRVLLRAAVPLDLVEGVISVLRQRC